MTAGLRAVALAGFVATCAIGCETRSGEETSYGPVATPPWTVGGARIGMTPEEVALVLGQPDRSNTSYGRVTNTYQDIGVTFDTAGRAVDIRGDRLNAPAAAGVGDVIVQRGVSEAEVVGRLGSGSSKSSYRPSGSGVISCGRKRAGGEHRYEDVTTVYTVGVYEDRLSFVRAEPRAATR
jgi:hypothetical protein